MEFLMEFILECFLEGILEITKNKNIPKCIRYPFIFLFILLFSSVLFGIFFLGIICFPKNIWAGIFLIGIGLFLSMSFIYKGIKLYKIRKNPKNVKDS